MKGIVWGALAALVIVACGGKDSKPAEQPAAPAEAASAKPEPAAAPDRPATVLTDADFPIVIALFDAVTKAVVDHAGDCNGMADALEKVMVEHASTIARVRLSRDDAGLNDRFVAAHGPHLQQGQNRMAPVLLTCQSNARVMKVFSEAF